MNRHPNPAPLTCRLDGRIPATIRYEVMPSDEGVGVGESVIVVDYTELRHTYLPGEVPPTVAAEWERACRADLARRREEGAGRVAEDVATDQSYQ